MTTNNRIREANNDRFTVSGRVIGMMLIVMLSVAAPLAAQQRGTMELGGFASSTAWDNNRGMGDSWGGGVRVGTFLFPRLSAEFEGSLTNSSRSLGRTDVNAAILSARLTAVPNTAQRGLAAIAMSVSSPFRISIGRGGQPGMCRSTGTTSDTPPTTA